MTWKYNAIGLITSAPDERENWDGFSFVAGVAGFGDSKPNEQLKPIEAKATGKGLPLLMIWDVHNQYYLDGGYPMKPELWPRFDQDKPYQMITRAIANRDCKAIILRFEYPDSHINAANGTDIDPSWVSFAGKLLAGRIATWCAANKPDCQVIIGASYDWIKAHGNGPASSMFSWVDDYPHWITQTPKTLDASYPPAEDKPGWLAVHDNWVFWQYHKNLCIHCDDVTALYDFLGFDGTVPPVQPPEPEPEKVLDTLTVIVKNLAVRTTLEILGDENKVQPSLVKGDQVNAYEFSMADEHVWIRHERGWSALGKIAAYMESVE